MATGVTLCIESFIKIGLDIQMLIGGGINRHIDSMVIPYACFKKKTKKIG
jgi:hypothetical protein